MLNVFEVASGYNQRQFYTSQTKFATELYLGNSGLIYLYVQDTQEDNNGLPAILLLLISTSACIDVFTGCMPPKTA